MTKDLPPHSPESEMALLGSMLIEPSVVDDVLELVPESSAFFAQGHPELFDCIVSVHKQWGRADPVAVVANLRARGTLERIGGESYIVELIDGVPSAANASGYARIVRDQHRLRELVALSLSSVDAAHAAGIGEGEADSVIEGLSEAARALLSTSRGSGVVSLSEASEKRLTALSEGEDRSLPSGYRDLDEILGGFRPGEMVILAARPAMGKTAFAMNIAEQVSRGGQIPGLPSLGSVPVGFFSLEMSAEAIAHRMLCAHAGIPTTDLKQGMLSEQQRENLSRAQREIADLDIRIDDSPGLTVSSLRRRAERMHGVRMIVIDYLQLLTDGKRRSNRQEEVSAISREIKAMARDLDIPVLCLSQINRQVEGRSSKRPQMSDLRESGAIEQDADAIMMLHREAYYHQGEEGWMADHADVVNDAEVIVAKHRNGPTGVAYLTWDAQSTRFRQQGGTLQI